MEEFKHRLKQHLVDIGYESSNVYIGRLEHILTQDIPENSIVITSFNGYSQHTLDNFDNNSTFVVQFYNVLYKGGEHANQNRLAIDKLFKDLNQAQGDSVLMGAPIISMLVYMPFMEFATNERNNLYYYCTLQVKYYI